MIRLPIKISVPYMCGQHWTIHLRALGRVPIDRQNAVAGAVVSHLFPT